MREPSWATNDIKVEALVIEDGLPKELTPELLSLVLGKKIVNVTDNCSENHLRLFLEIGKEHINIDTLSKLMRVFRYKNGLVIMEEWVTTTGNFDIEYTHENGDTTQFFNVTSEKYFECEVKATHWVAKEKGLI